MSFLQHKKKLHHVKKLHQSKFIVTLPLPKK